MIPENTSMVLDIGTRDCFIPSLMSDIVDYSVAVDNESALLKQGRNIFPIISDGSLLPIRSKSFDLVLCLEVLEHLPIELAYRVASELERVASKYILIGVPFEQDIRVGRTTCSICNKVNPPWGHRNSFSVGDLSDLFQRSIVRRIFYSGESKSRTNYFSAFLMNYSKNPFGRYEQIEKCIYCGNVLIRNVNISGYRIFIANLARMLTKIQRKFIARRPGHIHILLEMSTLVTDATV